MRNDNDASAITDTAYGIRNQLSVINIQSVRRPSIITHFAPVTTADISDTMRFCPYESVSTSLFFTIS